MIVTEPRRPTQVLLGIEANRRLGGARRTLVEALSMTGLAGIEFDPPRSRIRVQETT